MSEVRPPSITKAKGSAAKIAELMLKLQEDSRFLAEFNKDPDRIMIKEEIYSDEDRNTIKSGDIERIRRILTTSEA